jgi:uncharacterized protein DUF222
MNFEALADAIERLDVPGSCSALAEVLALRDRLEAKLAPAIAAVDHSGEWELEGAVSMTSWLRNVGRMSGGSAKTTLDAATKAVTLPVTYAAWVGGELSTAQVKVIAANVAERHVELFADHESAVVPALVSLSVGQTVIAMADWRRRAEALDDLDDAPDHERSLSLSKTFEGRGELTGSFDEVSTEVLDRALRLATTNDAEGENRSATERRADALIDVCRFFLDNQSAQRGGRHRPHVNVFVDVDSTVGGAFISGTPAPGALIETLLCDCNIHRVLLKGRSAILDYGRAARTAPPDLFNAIALRDGHCREPGCDRPPNWCDAHHVVLWEGEAGDTKLSNMVLRCSRHHHSWHKRRKLGWTERLEDDGTLVITDPNGRRYSSRPDGPLAQRQLWAS